MSYTSKRESILAALRTRLERIAVVNGFNTDAGAMLVVGETPSLGPDDPSEAIALVLQDDDQGHQGEHVVIRLPIAISALCRHTGTTPAQSLEPLITDIKRAIEDPVVPDPNRDLNGVLLRRGLSRGATRALKREPGSETVSATVEYLAEFGERWGAP